MSTYFFNEQTPVQARRRYHATPTCQFAMRLSEPGEMKTQTMTHERLALLTRDLDSPPLCAACGQPFISTEE